MNVAKENVVLIQGFKYALKKVTQLAADGGEPLGRVPVPYFPDDKLDLFLEWINGLGEYELKRVRDAWFYGEGVALQKAARNEAKGAGYNESEYDRIWDTLPGETLAEYAGNKAGLAEYIKDIWDDEQNENPTTYSKSYQWDKFAKLHTQLPK